MDKPLLSICIPTYNRASYLEQCLEAIVKQECFDNRVEVVVSDNCSTDDTQRVGMQYQEKYANIHYFRNKENVVDMNYPLVFQRATGCLRKLTNDTVVYKPGAIRYMLKAAEDNKEKKPQIYFLSLGKLHTEPKVVSDMEEYIDTIQVNLTWIRSFAVWDEDCDDFGVLVSKSDSRMAQVPYLLEHFKRRSGAVIYDLPIMDALPVARKNVSYGLYKVFYTTFLGFIKPYLDTGEISRDCFERLRKSLLLDFFCEWIVNKEKYPDQFIFSDENLKKLVEDEYRDEAYFGQYKRKLIIMRMKADVKKILKR